MISSLTSAATDNLNVVRIRVTGFTGPDVVRDLPAGDALVIGCSPACGLRLEGPGIAGLHCTISYDENGLTVEDWDTEIGTHVNGERVASRVVIECGAEVKIGSYRVQTERVGSNAAPPEEFEQEDSAPAEVVNEPVGPMLTELLRPEKTEAPSLVDDSQHVEDPPKDDGSDAWDTPFQERSETRQPEPAAYLRDGLDHDPAEILQVEIELLRTELAERDTRLAELQEFNSQVVRPQDEDLPSREEVESLVDRLEQLLLELEQSDERISTLSELLRVSEEAAVASQEEREQMESWIGEVERRVLQWEEEWHAERKVMERSIAELTAERDRAESRSGAPDQTELINELREHAQSLQSQLQQTQAERDDLSKRLEAADVASFESQVTAAVEAAMREERLQISQMKAEYARERADLAKQREEITSQQTSSASEPDIADVRIRAFREHLKEIRATEPSGGRQAPSLSQRLGKLWRKIDGKPLDTD